MRQIPGQCPMGSEDSDVDTSIDQKVTIEIKALLKYIPLRWQSNKRLQGRCITNARAICVRYMTAQATRSREFEYPSHSQLETTCRLMI